MVVEILNSEEWDRIIMEIDSIGIGRDRYCYGKPTEIGNFTGKCYVGILERYATFSRATLYRNPISFDEFLERNSKVVDFNLPFNIRSNSSLSKDVVYDRDGFCLPGEALKSFYNCDLGECSFGGTTVYVSRNLIGDPKIKRPIPFFQKKGDKKKDSVYFGVEIEYDGIRNEIDLFSEYRFSKRREENAFFYFCEDGSLNCGLEANTNPFTKEFYFKYGKEWIGNYVEDAGKHGAEDGCETGLHVHVSRSIGEESISFIRKFVNSNKNFFEKIGGREGNRWCCFVEEPTKYTAVNVKPEKTIELRFFKSSLDCSEVLGRIECAMALVDFSKSEGSVSTPNDFVRFAETSEYVNLKKILKCAGL